MAPTPTRREFVLACASGALAVVAGCGSPGGETDDGGEETDRTPTATPTATPHSTATPTDTPAAGPTRIRMVTDNMGSYFDPKGLLIDSGTTLRFVNESGVHATASYHPDVEDKPLRIPETAEPWESDLYSEGGREFDVDFDVPGVYDFYCPPHETLGMVGRIVVDEPLDGPGTTPTTDIPPAAQEKMPSIEDILANGTVAGP